MLPDWHPVRKSPIHDEFLGMGATLESWKGWLLPTHFGDINEEVNTVARGVGLCDLSFFPKWEIKGADFQAFPADVLGLTIPAPGKTTVTQEGYLCRLSRDHALFILNQDETSPADCIQEKLSQAGCVHAIERTSGLGNLLLCGPRSASVLRKLTPVDLREVSFPNLSCSCGPLAAIRALIVRKDRGTFPGYEILFSREYGEYLWKVIMEAGREFEIRPFGIAAAQLLEH